jgi:TonB family protein
MVGAGSENELSSRRIQKNVDFQCEFLPIMRSVKYRTLAMHIAGTALVWAATSSAQTTSASDLKVPAAAATGHLISKTEPVYPPLAKAANIGGVVVVEATIASDGHVAKVRALSGHPMLLQSAMDAVRKWRYQPFLLNGNAIQVVTRVEVNFSAPPDATHDLSAKYDEQEKACSGLQVEEKYAEADTICKKALEIALQLPGELYDTTRQRAYHYAGRAAFKLNRGTEALADFQESSKLNTDTTPYRDLLISHIDLARAYELVGQLKESDGEYEAADQALTLWKNDMKRGEKYADGETAKHHHQDLADAKSMILEGHVAVLRKLGRTADADALEQAAKDQH